MGEVVDSGRDPLHDGGGLGDTIPGRDQAIRGRHRACPSYFDRLLGKGLFLAIDRIIWRAKGRGYLTLSNLWEGHIPAHFANFPRPILRQNTVLFRIIVNYSVIR